MTKIALTREEVERFNREFIKEDRRRLAMSIFASVKYWQDPESGFLKFSLDSLFKERYKNKFYTTLANFRKIAIELFEKGFLKVIRRGKLKFYGVANYKNDIDIREENKKLKEENSALREELGKVKRELKDFREEFRKLLNSMKKAEEVVTEKEEDKEAVTQDVVIATAYDMMEEVGIQKGSTPFMQVIESLYAKTDREKIHKKGLVSYIKKVIHNKIHNQAKFIETIRKERKKPSIFITKAKQQEYIDLERKLLGWV